MKIETNDPIGHLMQSCLDNLVAAAQTGENLQEEKSYNIGRVAAYNELGIISDVVMDFMTTWIGNFAD